MEGYVLQCSQISAFEGDLFKQERSHATIEKYIRDVKSFFAFAKKNEPKKAITKETVLQYKQHLHETYKTTSANSILAALNCFFSFLGWVQLKTTLFKIQRRAFRDSSRELTKEEYKRLLAAAQQKENVRLLLLMQTICSTGIRVSEHKYITVEAIQKGQAQIINKGKERIVFLPEKLCNKLKNYCRQNKITEGAVFVTRSGKPLNRSNVWTSMQQLCVKAEVEPTKVFPHNLRHLFAITYYALEKDIAHLADLLGHASIDTTRIYTLTSGMEQLHQLAKMKLLL